MQFFSVLRTVWDFLRVRGKWWLAPVIALLVLFSLVIVIAEGSAVAPLIYAMF